MAIIANKRLSIITILSFIVCIFSFVSPHESSSSSVDYSSDEITNKSTASQWCAETPHPDTCNYFMSRFDPKSKEEFRTLMIRAALEQASDARLNLVAERRKSEDDKATRVYQDCNDLMEDAVHHLNNANLQSVIQTNDHDRVKGFGNSQTWLSTALTNIEVCRSEMSVRNLSSSAVLSGNVSQLISNSLATNWALVNSSNRPAKNYNADGFPSWLDSRNRKLLTHEHHRSLLSKASAVVSKDGKGQFKSIQDAINSVTSGRRNGTSRVLVYMKKGVYEENIQISMDMTNVMLVGDGERFTIITGNRSVSSGYTTYSSATVGINGPGFMARGITFRNTAGPQAGQAVAVRSASDLSVFYACSFEGYQDTLFAQAQRQFYKSCHIRGTVDFIFGNAAVVIQSSIIYVRKPLSGQANTITAQGRGDPFQNSGISIQNCRIMADADLAPDVGSVKTYLGRPWQQYSRTVVMRSYIGGLVDPQGWSTWDGSDFALDTLYYGEYLNSGPGSSFAGRVKWPGYHVIVNASEAAQFTVGGLISGQDLPGSGVPFNGGL